VEPPARNRRLAERGGNGMDEQTQTAAQTAEAPEAESPQPQMCCDGSGRTVEQHRHESPDGKCCVDE
jgi:hypothetical protein